MPESIERLKLGPLENPARGLLHTAAAAAALAVAAYLAQSNACRDDCRGLLLLLAASHGLLYTTSALYHSVPWSAATKARLQRLDHTMIYLAIASSLTPVVALSIDGVLAVVILAAVWALTAAGVAYKWWGRDVDVAFSCRLQLAIAALALPVLPDFVARHPGPPSWLLGIGLAAFGAGAWCFVHRRPVLWPRFFSFHEVFHCLTVVGSAAHLTLLVGYLSQVG